MIVKDKYIITILGTMLFISLVIGLILFELCNDLRATANGYKSDRNVCRMEKEEIEEEYHELEKRCK
jgi:hypothetical protein